jgi:hypothetical protein
MTITPTAIDAIVYIESIRIEGRHRKDLGDLTSLQRSIEDLGLLLHPIVITPDSQLVAGQRRLEACRRLGWVEVPVRIARSLDDAAKLLQAEMEENTERKEMLPSELASLGEALYELEAGRAKERQREHGGTAPGRQANTCGDDATSVVRDGQPGTEQNKTRTVVGNALGMGGTTYRDLRYVYTAAKDETLDADLRALAVEELKRIDETGKVAPSADAVRARIRARKEAAEAKAAATEPEPAAPEKPKRPNRTAADRLDRIRELAGEGYTSRQIADAVGISAETVRLRARENSFVIHADSVVGRGVRRIDSSRIVRETVDILDGLTTGIGLIDFDTLDGTQIDGWVHSLGTSISALNRLKKQLKERTQ